MARFHSEIKPFAIGLSDTESFRLQLRALEEENKILKEKLGRFVRTEVTSEEEQGIRKVFDRYDTDRSGSIEASELIKIFSELGEHLSIDEAAALLHSEVR
jgi:Ca2+-binding EF-hand superfamily protein